MPKRSKENRTIPVILLKDDKHLGEKYEQVRVAPIFARNVLLPQGVAVLATPMNIHNYAKKMLAAEEKRKKKAHDIDDFLMKVQQEGGIEFSGKVNEKGHLYAKISESDIANKIKEVYNVDVNDHYIKMKKNISEAGEFHIPFQYRDVKKDIRVVVKGEIDSAIAKKMEEASEKSDSDEEYTENAE